MFELEMLILSILNAYLPKYFKCKLSEAETMHHFIEMYTV